MTDIFQHRLKLLRETNKKTQEEIAQICGVQRQTIAQWESGKSLPNIKHLEAISSFFNISSDCLIGLREESEINRDMVEVTRCIDCMHSKEVMGELYCLIDEESSNPVDYNHFCGYGKKPNKAKTVITQEEAISIVDGLDVSHETLALKEYIISEKEDVKRAASIAVIDDLQKCGFLKMSEMAIKGYKKKFEVIK